MIKKLEHSARQVAEGIFTIFQTSYAIEADLIGCDDFPPLARSIKNIQDSPSLFLAAVVNNCLAGVIEIELQDKQLDVHSLTVAPRFFKQGIASELLSHVLTTFDYQQAQVETATANRPAISLYKKHGFVEFNRWTPAHGIEKLALHKQCESLY
ncbi:GNAT family N-acetyltransferase [Paraglaciecola aquimarina]|uniref:GNAT family N-acetyltransferase n=1 Tax=Paraglaciecola aquimarina TaxID=1235557 RepID=A0ABU3SZN6_9ALTE|nr:GNAT family N-acetyltransferase [Paraglaciecola aquimarina]MDU0355480.1 GNAT family N-acetyltransferase [Paraglaciecola aquimarina]